MPDDRNWIGGNGPFAREKHYHKIVLRSATDDEGGLQNLAELDDACKIVFGQLLKSGAHFGREVIITAEVITNSFVDKTIPQDVYHDEFILSGSVAELISLKDANIGQGQLFRMFDRQLRDLLNQHRPRQIAVQITLIPTD